ncbi:MAG TPA: glucoamylase family protein [Vicinamibacterales bacterium]|nr:glucoamylase family protein [Vicinamibacterales bacterium]
MNPPATIAADDRPELEDEFPGARVPLPLEQLESHARELAAEHSITRDGGPRKELLSRLDRNAERLEHVYRRLSEEGFEQQPETPSEEWLRDNHYVVRAQILEIRRNLPRKYYEELPTIAAGRWRRYPRVYVLARDFVTHTAGRFEQVALGRFADAYQDVAPLTIGELWAIPIMLRLALVENLCGLAVQALRQKQEREAARKFAVNLIAPEKSRTHLQLAAKASSTFVVELLHSLRDQSVASTAAWRWLQQRLTIQGQSPDELIRTEQHREAVDQLSIANIIGTMRMLSALDWPLFVESVSRVERVLRTDPVSAYADMDLPTRDRYRKSVEQLAKRSRVDEIEIAERAVRLAQTAQRTRPLASRTHHVGYYLISRGRFELEKELGYVPTLSQRIGRLSFRHPAIGYLGSLAITATVFEASALLYARHHAASWPMVWLIGLLTVVPVSELAISFLNAILTTIVPPRPLPKLALRQGVPDTLRTVVAVPTILSSPERVRELVAHLEVRALANHDPNISFALLGDFADADAETLPEDQEIVDLAIELIQGLNKQHGDERFYLFHRKRLWNPSEKRWMGWERKRGKLHEFNRRLRDGLDTSFVIQVGDLDRLASTRYVITLDSDTDLPLDAGKKLIGTIGHPLNHARFNPRARRVTEGYGILQPRVAIGAVSASRSTFSKVFSGHVGLDPYTTAVSDVYQDLFHEGSYVGKGIYDIDAFEQALAGRVPDNSLLSHDLFEGLFARVALCADLEVIDDYPHHYLEWAARLHRWTRGDWQLLPWLWMSVPTASGAREANALPSIARWKIADNLRRSLLPPALVVLLAAGWLFLPGGPALWTGMAFLVLFFPAYIQWGQSITSRIHGVRLGDHLRAERQNLVSSLAQVLLSSAFLAHQTLVMLGAIAGTLYRLAVSRSHFLEWVTAADMAARLELDRAQVMRRMWTAPALALSLGAVVAAVAPRNLVWAAPVVVLWALSPVLAYRTGLPQEEDRPDLEPGERRQLRHAARLTWRFFEEMVGARDNWLVPDNYQENRPDPIAHRTSPTNIGLQTLATVAAWDFGYLSTAQCIDRIERTLETVQKLARYRGHLFNWYDTQSLLPLAPLYVSTVDSGNLLGYLLTLKSALPQLVDETPVVDRRIALALMDTLDLFERDVTPLAAKRGRDGVRMLRADIKRLRSFLEQPPDSPHAWQEWLDRVAKELGTLGAGPHDAKDRAAWSWLDLAASQVNERRRELATSSAEIESLRERAGALVRVAEQLIEEAELDFLFDHQRNLFAIGYNVTEGRRDASCYDTLASEARLASFVAIATRQVPQEHWFKLGRSMAPVGRGRALISWSASMFEYLMPLLIMRTYPHTLLDETYDAVVGRQIEYARAAGVPWGISESAYNFQDAGANYQYRAFGVPGLGLKRGLADDLVVAPYATMLAAQIRPKEAVENLKALAAEGALGPMGFFESIDYTPDRVADARTRGVVVKTYMAHHHAMSLLAIDNCLHGHPMQKRFHSEPRVQAAELLLQERSPHLVPLDRPPDEHKVEETPGRALPTPVRRYVTPHTVTPRGHLLSNGSYSVMVTNSGGGYSRCGDLAVTRWREDVTLDGWGTFCYVRDLETGDFWSTAFHPTGREADHYEVTFAPDRAVLRRRDGDIELHTEITVSPEDNAEIRRVSVTNHSRAARAIELTSYAEVVLAPQGADLAHPVFSNLFVESTAVPDHYGIICARRPGTHEARHYLGHVVAEEGLVREAVQFETDRERFVGRGRTVRAPAALASTLPLSGSTGAVLDPIVSLRVRLRIPAGATARVAFTTAVAENEDGVRALIEKYRDPQVTSRAFALASTHSEIELRHLGITRLDEGRFQRLAARMIYGDPRLRVPEAIARNTGAPETLWKYGISGDLPIALVIIRDGGELGLAQELLCAQEYLRAKGFHFDLVVLNEIPTSYRQDVQDEMQRMAESGPSHGWIDKPGGLFLRRADAMSEDDRVLLRAVARAVLDGSRGGLDVQLKRPLLPAIPPPLLTVSARRPRRAILSLASVFRRRVDTPDSDLQFFNGVGGFAKEGREYHIVRRPPAPWVNVVANERFGFVASESGLGYTWSENSYQNRLTPWSNDPVVDPPGEAVYVRDEETGAAWSATASPGRNDIAYKTRFGQGFVVYEHSQDGLQVELTAFVPVDDPIKVLRLRIRNTSGDVRRLSAAYYVDWCLSDNRSRSAGQIVTSMDGPSGALFARNAFRPYFGQRVAFVDTSAAERTMTGDRTTFIGRNGSLDQPAGMQFIHLAGRFGAGLDPCGGVQARMSVAAGATVDVIFTLGEGLDEQAARALAQKYRNAKTVEDELEKAIKLWDERLRAVEVQTPDTPLNFLMNRWLEYQTLSCRIYARSAFYQSGGAFGFRDQLQDVLATMQFDPGIARRQILRAASRQFPEGDVQHWWHEPGGEGVRTRIQDDRLWLVYASLEYARTTGDWDIFNESAPFLNQRAPGPDEHSVYERPTSSPLTTPLYDHCTRAIERTMDTGSHGLPLMGTGDWNDGMDEVGAHGLGESVWLGWFLAALLRPFAELADRRGDTQRAASYRSYAARLAEALERSWDGEWYRRAYFDNGTPLGSKENSECAIDSVAQSWSVISGAGEPGHALQAMEAVGEHLVDRAARLILLLTPPFDRAEPNPGYIRGYVPGVRENGGQYTHAALWVVLAHVLLGQGDAAHELLGFINPINRASDPSQLERYRVEPYVVAADIYSAKDHVGRGGWTWYTGAAGWMYRVTLEHVLGIRREGEWLTIDPCIPRQWRRFQVTLRLQNAEYRIAVENPKGVNRGVQSVSLEGRALEDRRVPLQPGSGAHAVLVVLG